MSLSSRVAASIIGLLQAMKKKSCGLALIKLAKRYGRYGYRKIAALLRIEGWSVNHI